jgi:N-acetylmuramic acid 6-phosphate etherase
MRAIGIDGGGTHTRAVWIAADGRLGGAATAGCGNYQETGLQGLGRLLQELWDKMGLEPGAENIALCLALAGAGRRGEQEEIAAWGRDQGVASLVSVVSDAHGAFEGAHGGETGVIVIAGTGSMVLGRDTAGQWARAGGWGPLLGDEGSGYALGLAALRAVLRRHDGVGEDTLLGQGLKTALKLRAWEDIVAAAYKDKWLDRTVIASLAPVVFEAVEAGDRQACQIVETEGKTLGAQVASVAARLGLAAGAPVAGCGGLMSNDKYLRPSIEAGIEAAGGSLSWRSPLLPPVLGAALIARRLSGTAATVQETVVWNQDLLRYMR